MKTKWILAGFGLFALLAIGAGVLIDRQAKQPAPPRPTSQTFQAVGVVLRLDADGKTVLIEHEDIPQFMPAMTMPFTVKDPTLLRGLRTGDRVRFELTVTKDDSWISRIQKRTGPAETTSAAAATVSKSPSTDNPPELEIGRRVPDFALTDENGNQFRLADYRGQAVLVTFIYTRCPLPNYCPLMSKNFSELQKRLSRDFPGQFHLLTISFDPGYDTPAVLKGYAQAFTQDTRTWTFATGTEQQIRTVASEFGMVYLPENGTFTHDLRTALIAPDGQLIHIWRSNVWTPDEVRRWVAEVLQTQPQKIVGAAGQLGVAQK